MNILCFMKYTHNYYSTKMNFNFLQFVRRFDFTFIIKVLLNLFHASSNENERLHILV